MDKAQSNKNRPICEIISSFKAENASAGLRFRTKLMTSRHGWGRQLITRNTNPSDKPRRPWVKSTGSSSTATFPDTCEAACIAAHSMRSHNDRLIAILRYPISWRVDRRTEPTTTADIAAQSNILRVSPRKVNAINAVKIG